MSIFLFGLVLAWLWERIYVFSDIIREKKSFVYHYNSIKEDLDIMKEEYDNLYVRYRKLQTKHEKATKWVSYLTETRS